MRARYTFLMAAADDSDKTVGDLLTDEVLSEEEAHDDPMLACMHIVRDILVDKPPDMTTFAGGIHAAVRECMSAMSVRKFIDREHLAVANGMDPRFLKTLPGRDRRVRVNEMIKTGAEAPVTREMNVTLAGDLFLDAACSFSCGSIAVGSITHNDLIWEMGHLTKIYEDHRIAG